MQRALLVVGSAGLPSPESLPPLAALTPAGLANITSGVAESVSSLLAVDVASSSAKATTPKGLVQATLEPPPLYGFGDDNATEYALRGLGEPGEWESFEDILQSVTDESLRAVGSQHFYWAERLYWVRRRLGPRADLAPQVAATWASNLAFHQKCRSAYCNPTIKLEATCENGRHGIRWAGARDYPSQSHQEACVRSMVRSEGGFKYCMVQRYGTLSCHIGVGARRGSVYCRDLSQVCPASAAAGKQECSDEERTAYCAHSPAAEAPPLASRGGS